MLIAALAIGLLAAYYMGLRVGIAAAATTAVLLLAALIPGIRMYAYLALAAGVGFLLVVGPKLKKEGTAFHYALRARGHVVRLRKRVGSLWSSERD